MPRNRILKPLAQTSREAPPKQQFAYWRNLVTCRMMGLSSVGDGPPDCFPVTRRTWRFGCFALSDQQFPASEYWRLPEQIRRDGFDHWMVSIVRKGSHLVRVHDEICDLQPGQVLISSMDQPFRRRRSDADCIHVYVSRDGSPEIGRAMDSARNRPLRGPLAMLLHDYLLSVAAKLPEITEAAVPGLEAATRTMFVAALMGSDENGGAASSTIEALQISRVKRLIRENISSAVLSSERVARMAGFSRSKLYTLFEPLGGVARFIREERLRRAYLALTDPRDPRGIQQVAEAVGFFDQSTFNRLINAKFQCSPGELRKTMLLGQHPRDSTLKMETAAPSSLNEILLTL